MDEKTFAQRMRVARFVVRVLVIVALVTAACRMGLRLRSSAESTQSPAVCTVMTEETFAEKPDKPDDADGKSSKDVPTPQKRIIKERSSWVQVAHSTLLLGSQAALLAMLVWGIVAVMKQED